MRLAPSFAWALEFTVYLLRHLYITFNLKKSKSGSSFIHLFPKEKGLQAHCTPIIFFLHNQLHGALVQILTLTRVIRATVSSVLSQSSKSSKDSETLENIATFRQVDHIMSRTFLREDSMLTFMTEVGKACIDPNGTSISDSKTMLIHGTLPASLEPALGQLQVLFQSHSKMLFGQSLVASNSASGDSVKPITDPSEILQCLFSHSQPRWIELKSYPLATQKLEVNSAGQKRKFESDQKYVAQYSHDVVTKSNLWEAKGLYQCDCCSHFSKGKQRVCVCGGHWSLIASG